MCQLEFYNSGGSFSFGQRGIKHSRRLLADLNIVTVVVGTKLTKLLKLEAKLNFVYCQRFITAVLRGAVWLAKRFELHCCVLDACPFDRGDEGELTGNGDACMCNSLIRANRKARPKTYLLQVVMVHLNIGVLLEECKPNCKCLWGLVGSRGLAAVLVDGNIDEIIVWEWEGK